MIEKSCALTPLKHSKTVRNDPKYMHFDQKQVIQLLIVNTDPSASFSVPGALAALLTERWDCTHTVPSHSNFIVCYHKIHPPRVVSRTPKTEQIPQQKLRRMCVFFNHDF